MLSEKTHMRIRTLYKGYKVLFFENDVPKFLNDLDEDTKEEIASNFGDIEAMGIAPEQIGKQGRLYKPLDCRWGTLFEMKLRTKQKEVIRLYFHPDSENLLIILLLAVFKQGRSRRQNADIVKACKRLGKYLFEAR